MFLLLWIVCSVVLLFFFCSLSSRFSYAHGISHTQILNESNKKRKKNFGYLKARFKCLKLIFDKCDFKF